MAEIILAVLGELAIYFKRLRYWVIGLGILFLVVVASLRGIWDWTLAAIVAAILGCILVLGHFADAIRPYHRKEPWDIDRRSGK